MHFQLNRTRIPPVGGFHFGSRFPGNPDHLSVYDFVPDCIFSRIVNRAAFLGVLVLDKWMAQHRCTPGDLLPAANLKALASGEYDR